MPVSLKHFFWTIFDPSLLQTPKPTVLHQLSIVGCPKLLGRLPEYFPSLKRFVIRKCEELLVSIASLPEDCRLEIDGCKQVHPRTKIDFGSQYPIVFSDVHRDQVYLIKRFKQSQSEDEGVEIVGYAEPTSLRSAVRNLCNLQSAKLQTLSHLLHENEEELQLRGLPYVCHYLASDNVCIRTLPQVGLNLGFLRWIGISNCSDLVSFPEASLPSHLRAVDIQSCDLLECLPDLWMESTSLECLRVSHCKSLVHLARNQLSPNLKELRILECNGLKTLMQEENKSLRPSIIGIAECSSTKSSFSKNEFPATLELISIDCCDKLEALPHNMHQLNHLRDLTISNCSSLVSFPAGGLPSTNLTNLQIKYCYILVYFPAGGHPFTNLKKLEIVGSETLKGLPNDMHQLHHLQVIQISECSSLVSFPEEGLPSTNLTELIINDCEKLEALPNGMHQLYHLQMFRISQCSSLVSFPEGGLPSTNLTELIIKSCKKLEALPNGMHQLHHLQKIGILYCSSIVSFPEGGLPSTNLTELTICAYEKLKGLPKCMHNLSSLQKVRISYCQAMESLPEDGFPINLQSLHIYHTPKICQPLFKRGLHRRSSLTDLCIMGCPDVVSFPPEETGIMLPSSLTILQIGEFEDLECVSSVIQSFNSLETLRLSNCRKLKSFPKKGLPSSLLDLDIRGCPLLYQNCEMYEGRYWPMIAYIPRISTRNF